MAPFIKYTRTEETRTGTRREIRFINASQIVEAYFHEDTGELAIQTIRSGGDGTHDLKGEEAIKALKTLESLQGH